MASKPGSARLASFLAQSCTGLLFLSGAGASAKNCQLVVMGLKPGEDIGVEVNELDRSFRVEQGEGKVLDAALCSAEPSRRRRARHQGRRRGRQRAFRREDDRIAKYDNCKGRTLSALASNGNEATGIGIDFGATEYSIETQGKTQNSRFTD